MHKQPDLFSPSLATVHASQPSLFDPNAVEAGDTNLACVQCGRLLVRTGSGYLCCPCGCGKLLEERTDPEPECTAAEGIECECDLCQERQWEASQESFNPARWVGPTEDVR